jgi:phenylalanine-4-hydroxylase
MFEEGQLYAPVTEDGNGVTVHLAPDHPGANDPEYRRRREEIAGPALRWTPGEPVPRVEYTDAENEIWRTVCAELAPKHERLAIRGFLEGKEALGLPTDHVPQLDEVSARLEPLSGFRLNPAAGLVPLDQFYGSLADGIFHSTQYLRHGSQPLYTPEPDIIHEVVGHGNLLANPAIAEVKRRAGEAARRCETPEGLQFVADVFWFTIEFGVMYEDGELRCYGVPERHHPPARLPRPGHARLRHLALPAHPLRLRRDERADRARGRVLRRVRRRDTGAYRRAGRLVIQP